MTMSRSSLRVCNDPVLRRPARRRAGVAALIAVTGALALSSSPASAANNPGSGDTGFFTFRPTTPTAGSSVNVASGNLLVRTRDLSDSLLNYGVVVDRAYNSLAPNSFSILSPRWSFDIGPSTKVTEQTGGNVIVDGPSGYSITFARQTDGSYIGPAGFDGSLAKTTGGWTLLRNSHSDQYGLDNQGVLSTTKDAQARDFTVQNTSAAGRTVFSSYGTADGRRVNLSYTGDSLVREMDNPASGHHYYTYAAGKLTGYQDPAGPQTAYHYDGNGLLDKITEPGGTTVDVVMHPSGKVQSSTSTAPGGTGQTTSFVYTRRPYKTDVTAPSGVRRTDAYDDDWRVTRQYNPDVTPTVTASGDLRDLAGQYVNGNETYPVTVAADEPDSAGLTHLGLERSGGVEIVDADTPCTDTPFDHICPTSFAAPLQANLTSVPEGRQTLHGTAADDEQHHSSSDTWDVLVDRTAPGRASNLTVGDVDAGGNVTATWDPAADPSLPDGAPGSGTMSYSVRYAVNGGEATESETTSSPSLTLHGVTAADYVTLEITATDAVGNEGTPVQLTDVAGPLEAPDPADENLQGQPGWDDQDAIEALPDGALVPTPPDPEVEFTPAPDQGATAARGSASRDALPPISNAGDHWIAHPENSTWGSFRNRAQQFFIGSIKKGDSFYVFWQKPRGKVHFNSSWGYFKPDSDAARGGVCGWVTIGNIDPADGALNRPSPPCQTGYDKPPNMGTSISKMAKLVNCDICNGGSGVHLKQNAQVYRNIVKDSQGNWNAVPEDLDAHLNPTSHNRSKDVLEAGKDVFAWRYVTTDGRWLAGYNGNRIVGFHWGFILKEHVEGSSDLCSAMNGHPQPTQLPKHQEWPDVCDTTTRPHH